jgi:hypothetical protein
MEEISFQAAEMGKGGDVSVEEGGTGQILTSARRVRLAADAAAEPTKLAPIKIVGGRAWSPGIYRSLRILGNSLEVAWERAFIHPLTFN